MPDIMIQTMALVSEIAKSESHAKFSISPLVHSLGVIKAEADIQLKPSIMFWPEIKVTVNIVKIDEVIKKARETGLFSASQLESIVKIVDKIAIRKENGDASITIESKAGQPGTYIFKR